MSYKKLVSDLSGTFKEINASIDGNNLSSSYILSTNSASIIQNNGLLLSQNGILSSLSGAATNHVLSYRNNQITSIVPLADSDLRRYGDILLSTTGAQIKDISNVVSGTLPSVAGGTNRNSYDSGSVAVYKYRAPESPVPAVLSKFETNATTDSSVNNNTITFYNGTVVTASTPSPYSATALSCSYNGISSNSAIPAIISRASVLSGDFTIECWVYLNNYGSYSDTNVKSCIFGYGLSGGSGDQIFEVGVNSVGNYTIWTGNTGGRQTSTVSCFLNKWHHVSLVRTGNNLIIYVNGVASSPIAVASSATGATYNTHYVGSTIWGNACNGFISRYFSYNYAKSAAQILSDFQQDVKGRTELNSFTPIDIDSSDLLSVLVSFNNTSLGDDSINLNTITRPKGQIVAAPAGLFSGNAVSSSFDATTANYTAAITLTNAHSGDFTLEGWTYLANAGANTADNNRSIIFQSNDSTKFSLLIQASSVNSLTGNYGIYDGGSTVINTGINFIPNQWVHCALVRNNNVYKAYINGTGSVSIAAAQNTSFSTIYVGTNGNANWNINGYMSEVAMTKFAKTESEIINYYNATKANPVRRTKYNTPNKKIISVNSSNNLVLRDERYINSIIRSTPTVYLYACGDTYPQSYNISTDPNVYAYTTFTWTKPSWCKIVRVICQGSGGGGASGGADGGPGGVGGGDSVGLGGSGGAFSDIFLNVSDLSTVEIKCGLRGFGAAPVSNVANGLRGCNGGPSAFGNYVFSNGGTGGAIVAISSVDYLVGPDGYRYNGGYALGNQYEAINGGALKSVYMGGPGGGCGGGRGAAGTSGGNITRFGVSGGGGGASGTGTTSPGYNGGNGGNGAETTMFNFSSVIYNNGATIGLPNLICGGGGGGGGTTLSSQNGTAGDGGYSMYGGGGGGGGQSYRVADPFRPGRGGTGGQGYVLVICY